MTRRTQRGRYRPLRFGRSDARVRREPPAAEEADLVANGVAHIPGEMDRNGVQRCQRCREIIVDAHLEAVRYDLENFRFLGVTAYPDGTFYGGRDPSATDCAPVPKKG